MAFLPGTIAVLILAGTLTGCSAINVLFDDADVFVNERNSEVGKPISKALSSTRYYPYWENQPAHLKKHYKVVPIGSNQSEYHFEMGSCQWALIVESNLVTKWRFVKQTSDCGYKQFHEGPF